ncbi:HotDog domain-containing protein [Aspergillus caelatus]|uniref:HotDog domain-containing protein n=1 Tax=Aspergillus caelatus TaxID=61420 RepID=A0A5N6ZSD0_9EURO|nr:HotDog domain-containing protein [Aspergillus caelatus]KAE8360474.1 HotDog domain-containing protein [Aspergillus caelatus]
MPKGRLDKILPFIEAHSISAETLDHFAGIPWTNQYLSNPAYRAIPTYGRVQKPDSSEDYLFAQTMNTPTTIPHFLTLQRTNFILPPESPKGSITLGTERRTTPYRAPEYPDCIVLVELGASGLDGHSGLLHGGIAGAILDETLGLMASLHLATLSRTGLSGFTASLNITYRAPVSTPGTVIVRNWVEAYEGRKWVCRGQIVDGSDVVLTEAEALLVSGARKVSL